MIILALAAASFLAANIGANNSAAAMSPAYGSGARTKREALLLVGIFAFLGALFQGKEVILTLGTRLVNPALLPHNLAIPVIVILIAGITVFLANRTAVPVATTHAIVCAMAAAGLFFQAIRWESFLVITVWWMITPIFAGILSYIMGKYVYYRVLSLITRLRTEARVRKAVHWLLTFSGCYVAFTAGGNNAANAAGPLIALHLLTPESAALLAGVSMGLGALWLGGGVLESSGKGIAELCAARAVFIEVVAATVIFFANRAGMPISLAETVTGALIGLGLAQKQTQSAAQQNQIRKIMAFWVLSPVSVFLVTLGVFKILWWG